MFRLAPVLAEGSEESKVRSSTCDRLPAESQPICLQRAWSRCRTLLPSLKFICPTPLSLNLRLRGKQGRDLVTTAAPINQSVQLDSRLPSLINFSLNSTVKEDFSVSIWRWGLLPLSLAETRNLTPGTGVLPFRSISQTRSGSEDPLTRWKKKREQVDKHEQWLSH